MATKIALLAGLASAWYMTGLIVFVHRVHYPLFDKVMAESFRVYHAEHVRRTTPVVFLPMVVELLASLFLVYQRPPGTSPWLAWAGASAALVCWLSTAGLSVPLHEQLSQGFDTVSHRRLVRTNAVRLVAWVVHAVIMTAMTASAMT